MSACTRDDCGGTIATDGYCDTCGYAAAPAPTSPPPPPPSSSPSPRSPARESRASRGAVCTESGCGGTIAADGYCDTCGIQPTRSHGHAHAGAAPTGSSTTATATIAAPEAPATSKRIAASGGSSESRRARTLRTSSTRTELGAGLVTLAPTVAGDPASAVMSREKIQTVLGTKAEDERFCSSCGQPVGRASGDEPGRITGFCGNCRTPFDFVTNSPKLQAGVIVGGQYKILGPIAHGGMGWIYLGQDTAVSNRWVVLKGLLNEDDEDAAASAVAERQFLARIEHGSIVNIYNFVTWEGAGYIVMEYVGGDSLNSKLKDRRKANGGRPNPLPIGEAIAYVLGVLPAIGYLHDLGLVYNDLKPANIMAVGDTVKLIDVGGVMQADDESAAIFGTQGFQAPEVATIGPSVASDLFTVGRTLAVLALNFVYHQGQYQYEIPTAIDEPLFDRWESLYRFLLKATAEHPDDRFQTADDMAEQLLGVLREIVAIGERSPRPTSSALFGGDRLAAVMLEDDSIVGTDWRALPTPKVAPEAEGAAFLYDLPELAPESTLRLLDEGIATGTAPDSPEVRLRRAREIIDDGGTAAAVLRAVEDVDPWDWRVTWYRSIQALRDGSATGAAEGFSRVWTELPGELAPKQAVALAAELAGEYRRAADLYAEVIGVDASYVSAAFGLARCRVARGDRQGAVDAYRSVPPSSATYTEAQVASARVLVGKGDEAAPSATDIASAAGTIEAARIDGAAKSKLATEVLERALHSLETGVMSEDPGAKVFGNPLTARGLRRSLERTYRDLARVAETAEERFELVDRANEIRVPSLL
ncbi:MAG: serine/threonine-protein kinase PknG [Verrucomicrobiales bacterium]|jgi:serine/threonine-protein kinase PknG